MDKLHCALCGTDHGKLVAHHFVTVDVVEDPDGEMVGGTVEHHNIYLCAQCGGKAEHEPPLVDILAGCVAGMFLLSGSVFLAFLLSLYIPFLDDPYSVILAWLVIVSIPSLLQLLGRRWGHQDKVTQLQKVAAALHDGPGPVRVFTLEQFWDFEARRKNTDGAKSLPTLLTPKGRTIDLRDPTPPDEFMLDDDEYSTQRCYDDKNGRE